VFNQSVTETKVERLHLKGHYANAVEKTLEGDFPIPVAVTEEGTEFVLRLAPGEGTLIALGARAEEKLVQGRRMNEGASSPTRSMTEFEKARTGIIGTKSPLQKKAEALALVNIAQRHESLGYHDRAGKILQQAIGMEDNPPPYHHPDDEVKAPRARESIVLDGELRKWKDTPRYPVRHKDGAGGEFGFQWDDNHLYLMALVQDPDLKWEEEAGGDYHWIWGYDGVRLVINAADTAPITSTGALYDARYRAGQNAIMASISGRKYVSGPGAFSAGGIRSATHKIPGGYMMEVALPFKDLMISPLRGASFGFKLEIVNQGSGLSFGKYGNRENYLSDNIIFNRLLLDE
jgi:hypothetical protein